MELTEIKSLVKDGTIIAQYDTTTVIEAFLPLITDSSSKTSVIITYGPQTTRREGLAMEMVGNQTSIPVPQVIAIQIDESLYGPITYIVQEKRKGIALSKALPRMDEEACVKVSQQLKDILLELSSKLDAAGPFGRFHHPGLFHHGVFCRDGICEANDPKGVIDYLVEAASPIPAFDLIAVLEKLSAAQYALKKRPNMCDEFLRQVDNVTINPGKGLRG